jgi:hypothetical protein
LAHADSAAPANDEAATADGFERRLYQTAHFLQPGDEVLVVSDRASEQDIHAAFQ